MNEGALCIGWRQSMNERETRMCMNEAGWRGGGGGGGWKVMDEPCMASVSGESLGSV